LHKFVVLPKRWIVERTLGWAWISRNRRLARDFERYARHRRSLRPPRHDPNCAATLDQANSFNMNSNFPDRLLAIFGNTLTASAGTRWFPDTR
jgi:hypothetical protein